MADAVTLELTPDEALVFFDWLARTGYGGQPAPFVDQAEQRVLWDLEARLESTLSAVVASDYGGLLHEARSRDPRRALSRIVASGSGSACSALRSAYLFRMSHLRGGC